MKVSTLASLVYAGGSVCCLESPTTGFVGLFKVVTIRGALLPAVFKDAREPGNDSSVAVI